MEPWSSESSLFEQVGSRTCGSNKHTNKKNILNGIWVQEQHPQSENWAVDLSIFHFFSPSGRKCAVGLKKVSKVEHFLGKLQQTTIEVKKKTICVSFHSSVCSTVPNQSDLFYLHIHSFCVRLDVNSVVVGIFFQTSVIRSDPGGQIIIL